MAKRGRNPCRAISANPDRTNRIQSGWPGEPFEREADSFAGQKDATVSLSDRHVPVPIGVSKVPEASGFFRGVAELGVVTVLGATFHEVNPVARGRLKLVDVRQAPAQLA